MYGGGSGLRLNDGFNLKLDIVDWSLMVVFVGWTCRGLISGFLALARSVGIKSHEHSSLLHHRVLVD